MLLGAKMKLSHREGKQAGIEQVDEHLSCMDARQGRRGREREEKCSRGRKISDRRSAGKPWWQTSRPGQEKPSLELGSMETHEGSPPVAGNLGLLDRRSLLIHRSWAMVRPCCRSEVFDTSASELWDPGVLQEPSEYFCFPQHHALSAASQADLNNTCAHSLQAGSVGSNPDWAINQLCDQRQLCKPQFETQILHLSNGDGNTCLTGIIWKLETIYKRHRPDTEWRSVNGSWSCIWMYMDRLCLIIIANSNKSCMSH